MAKKNSEAADGAAGSKGARGALGKRKGASKVKEPKVKKQRFTRIKELVQAYKLLKPNDPRLGLWIGLSALLGFVVSAGLWIVLGGFGTLNIIFAVITGLLVGLLVGLIVFGIRARRTTYAQAEGRPGAAAWAMEQMRGDWRITQAVAATTHQDVVHRVIGKPGIVLVAEGEPRRLGGLIASEKKRLARVVGDTPIYTVTIGDGDDQVPLKRLNKHLTKLPRNIQGAQIRALDKRLQAVGAPKMPIPKGPLPQGRQMAVSNRQMRRKGLS